MESPQGVMVPITIIAQPMIHFACGPKPIFIKCYVIAELTLRQVDNAGKSIYFESKAALRKREREREKAFLLYNCHIQVRSWVSDKNTRILCCITTTIINP